MNLQPLSRELAELMSRKEWSKARKCAEELAREANRAYATATMKETHNG
jgi:hypothetical protein